MRPLLSICIPTYNREIYLRECLESIYHSDLDNRIEIIVSDNFSTDQTLMVLEEFKDLLPIRWIIQDSNIGADRNFDAIVLEARGEYCWLLGSDDIITASAIPRLIELLDSNYIDILQFGYIQADIDLKPIRKEFPPTGQFNTTPIELAQHFTQLSNLSLLFTFISAFIFRRSIWINRHLFILSWIGSNYIQTAAMHSALADGARLLSIEDCLVVARGNNPNEFNTTPGRFVSLDAKTVERLIVEIYSDSLLMWEAIGKTFQRSYPVRALIYIAANGGFNYLSDVDCILIKLGYRHLVLLTLRMTQRLKLMSIVRYTLNIRRSLTSCLVSKG